MDPDLLEQIHKSGGMCPDCGKTLTMNPDPEGGMKGRCLTAEGGCGAEFHIEAPVGAERTKDGKSTMVPDWSGTFTALPLGLSVVVEYQDGETEIPAGEASITFVPGQDPVIDFRTSATPGATMRFSQLAEMLREKASEIMMFIGESG